MNLLAFNGSPRKGWNTHKLLENLATGFKSKGGNVELVHLYDLNFKGCISCFSCKLKGGKSYGRCVVKDDLKQYLDKIDKIDAIVISAPIYIGNVTANTRALIERLTYPLIAYREVSPSLFENKIKVGMIYNMGADEQRMTESNYMYTFNFNESVFKLVFGHAESLIVTDTYQFDDYSKYEASRFNVEEKKKRRDNVFPVDCKKAFDMGVKFADEILNKGKSS